MSIGSRIKELRQKNNLTQSELAGKLNVTRQAVTKWENDKSAPAIDTLTRLSELFNVSKEYLVTGNEIKSIEENPSPKRKNSYRSYIKLGILSLTIAFIAIISFFLSFKITGKEAFYDLGFYITLDEEYVASDFAELNELDTPTFINSSIDVSINRHSYLNYLDRYTLELLLPYNRHSCFYFYALSINNNRLIVGEPIKYSLAELEANAMIKFNEYTIIVNEAIPLSEISVSMLDYEHNILNTERIFINEEGLIESSIYGLMDYSELENHFILYSGVSFSVTATNLLGEVRSYNIYNTRKIRLCLAPYIENAYRESYLFYFYI